jgi:hypothetical protein
VCVCVCVCVCMSVVVWLRLLASDALLSPYLPALSPLRSSLSLLHAIFTPSVPAGTVTVSPQAEEDFALGKVHKVGLQLAQSGSPRGGDSPR